MNAGFEALRNDMNAGFEAIHATLSRIAASQ
jgi:hypothetical protein